MEPEENQPQAERLTVLFVEDNDDHAELVVRSLGVREDRRIVRLRDGQSALDCLYGRGAFSGQELHPDLVLLDLRLPRLDGLEVLRRLRQDPAFSALPVVVLSTSWAEGDVAAAYAAHANSYVVKPAEFDKFKELIGVLGQYWLRWNCRPGS